MTGAPSLTCPECGRTARSQRAFLKTRRRWRLVILALFFLLLPGIVSLRIPRALMYGWLDAVPLVLLRPALWWQRDRAEALHQTSGPLALTNQWDRLLYASAINRTLSDTPPTAMFAARIKASTDLRMLVTLGRDARPAAKAVRQQINGPVPEDAVRAMIALTSAGLDFSDDLMRGTRQYDHSGARVAAVEFVVERALADGKVSLSMRQCLQAGALEANAARRLIDATLSLTDSPVAVQMLRWMLEADNPEVQMLALEAIAPHANVALYLEPTLARSARSELPPVMHASMATVMSHYSPENSEWGPRLVALCESTDPFARARAAMTLSRWSAASLCNPDSLRDWLTERDRHSPSLAPREVLPWMRVFITSTEIRGPDTLNNLVNAALSEHDDAIELLLAIITEHDSSECRATALQLLKQRKQLQDFPLTPE